MNINIYKLAYFFCLTVLIGCRGTKKSNDYKPLPPNKHLEKYANVSNFDSLFSLTDSIQLENSNDAILGYAWEASRTKNTFIVSDPIGVKSVKAYNNVGNFIDKIGGNGRGPDEYISPDLLAANSEYVVIYDPTQMKIIIFSNSLQYINSWKVSHYIEQIQLDNKNRLIILRKFGFGYKRDLDIYDLEGNVIYSVVLPKSSKEVNRIFLFGGSYKIAVRDDRLYYIGADEYKILCFNLNKREFEWVSNELPNIIKIPDIPANLSSRKRIAWMKENYTPLRGFYVFDIGLEIIHVPNNFLLYDNYGNYLTKIYVKDEDKIYFSQGNDLYEVTFPEEMGNGVVLNPKIITYKLIGISK